MSKQFVKISNRGTYTNQNRAKYYVERRFAEPTLMCVRTKRVLEIRMLEAAELAIVRSQMRRAAEDRTVPGNFGWYVGDSGGSQIMKDGTARGTKSGVSGGYRVLKASHGVV